MQEAAKGLFNSESDVFGFLGGCDLKIIVYSKDVELPVVVGKSRQSAKHIEHAMPFQFKPCPSQSDLMELFWGSVVQWLRMALVENTTGVCLSDYYQYAKGFHIRHTRDPPLASRSKHLPCRRLPI